LSSLARGVIRGIALTMTPSDQTLTFPVVPGPILSGMPWNRIHLPAAAGEAR
jgi:hypothetical protein